MAKRQTVWLSTMMILSLMVIGYYTVDDTLQPVPTTTETNAKDLSKHEQSNTENKGDTNKQDTQKQASGASDWFIEQTMKLEKDYSAKVEQLQKVMADGNSTTEQKANAEKEMRDMTTFSDKADQVADKVMAEGYEDALITRDSDRINVTVQTSELSKEQVAKIYGIVAKELNVSASQIVVSYRQ